MTETGVTTTSPGRVLEERIEYVVETRNLTRRFGKLTAVDGVDLKIPRGVLFGFVGPSGCGKTTTVRLLLGILKPDEGEALVRGISPSSFGVIDRRAIGYMPQLFALDRDLTVWENLHFAASLYGVKLRREDRLHEVLRLVELEGREKERASNLSGGMQRRLSLAAALVHEPAILFLDEPTAGIDPVLRRKFWNHFYELQERGHTLFITTQYVNEAGYCDLVGVMSEGRLLDVDEPDALRRRIIGGDLIELQLTNFPQRHQIEALRDSSLVEARAVEFDGADTLTLRVADAAAFLPRVITWCEEHDLSIRSAQEYVTPFDDVFVKLFAKDDDR